MLEWGLKDGGLKDGDGTSSSKKTAVSKSPFTPPTTKIAPKNTAGPKRKPVFQPLLFRGYVTLRQVH